jgi:hypothetical protein
MPAPRTTQLYDRRAEEVTLDERGARGDLRGSGSGGLYDDRGYRYPRFQGNPLA